MQASSKINSVSYKLLDCGQGRRLDQIGNFVVDRPSPGSTAKPDPTGPWLNCDALYTGQSISQGKWNFNTENKKTRFMIHTAGLNAELRLTPSGQIGIFREQSINWRLLRYMGRRSNPASKLNLLNLFAYTGLSTVAALQGGHKVCHVDAAKSVVQWARHNAELNQLNLNNARYIIEDARKFCIKEIKRRQTYNAFILDPPAFGRGTKKEQWKIERDLPELLGYLNELCNGQPRLLILSAHHTNWDAQTLKELMIAAFPKLKSKRSFYKYVLREHAKSGSMIQSSFCCSFIS